MWSNCRLLLLALALSLTAACSEPEPEVLTEVRFEALKTRSPGRKRATFSTTLASPARLMQIEAALGKQLTAFCESNGPPHWMLDPELASEVWSMPFDIERRWPAGKLWQGEVECEGDLPAEMTIAASVDMSSATDRVKQHFAEVHGHALSSLHDGGVPIGSDWYGDKYRAFDQAIGSLVRTRARHCEGHVAIREMVTVVQRVTYPLPEWLQRLQRMGDRETPPREQIRVYLAADTDCLTRPGPASPEGESDATALDLPNDAPAASESPASAQD